jgi:hypothetical protein
MAQDAGGMIGVWGQAGPGPMISVPGWAALGTSHGTEIMGVPVQPMVPFTLTILKVPPNAVMPFPAVLVFKAWAKKYSGWPL